MIFVHIFYWAFGGTDGGFPRYYYDALPAFLLLTVRGIQISGDLLAQSDERPSPRRWRASPLPGRERGWGRGWLRWLPIFAAILFTAYNLLWTLPLLLATQKGKYGITAAPLEVVEQAGLSEPALVIVKNVARWNDFAAPFAANSPTLAGPIVYASDEGAEMTKNLREQFKDRTCWELEGKELKRCEEVDGRQ
ncbi:MAG: hypothetical protein HC875_25565 [Anaerolineales bacterium]|nr:hypothetical protein [Anaerolineales bacterium]